MKKTLILLALCASTSVWGQAISNPTATTTKPDIKVSLTAKGTDVRMVLAELFEKAKKSFIINPAVKHELFLSLQDVSFDRALTLVCNIASLRFEEKDGVYHVWQARATVKPSPTPAPVPVIPPVAPKINSTPVITSEKPTVKPVPTSVPTSVRTVIATPVAAAKPAPVKKPTLPSLAPKDNAWNGKGVVPASVLQRKLTTRLSKTDIREVFAELAKQTSVRIEVDKSVPNYKLDAFLVNTSLRYALDEVTEAAGLEYRLTEYGTIMIFMTPPNAKPAR